VLVPGIRSSPVRRAVLVVQVALASFTTAAAAALGRTARLTYSRGRVLEARIRIGGASIFGTVVDAALKSIP
jgi:hypothetical protein